MLISLGLRSNVDLFDFLPLVYSIFTLEVFQKPYLVSMIYLFYQALNHLQRTAQCYLGLDSHLGAFGASKWI